MQWWAETGNREASEVSVKAAQRDRQRVEVAQRGGEKSSREVTAKTR